MDDRKLLSPIYSGLRNTIPPSTFLGVKSPVPPRDEQVAILEFLAAALTHSEQTTAHARQEIELLNEYRTRLIADVVTGKLDVREAAAELPIMDDERVDAVQAEANVRIAERRIAEEKSR